mgnify:CR=1 FL=1
MKRTLTLSVLLLVLGGCATTELNKLERVISGYGEKDFQDYSYKGFLSQYDAFCYGIIEYKVGDIYSGEVSQVVGKKGSKPFAQGKGVLVKEGGEVISGEWRNNEIISSFFIPTENLKELANNCADLFSETSYYTPVKDFKKGLKKEFTGFSKGSGELLSSFVETTLITAFVITSIATSPAALDYQQSKNQKKREQAAYNKGKRDGKRKAAKRKAAMCQLNRNC